MGPSASALDAGERLRPWLAAGLRYLYRPGRGSGPGRGPEAWPAPWDEYLRRAPKSARIVWTYHLLGRDLGGSPDPARAALFRGLLGALGWPKGTTAFWPCTEPVRGNLVENPRLFWRGCLELGVPVVAFFGEDADLVLGSGEPSGAAGRIKVITLPDPALLLEMSEEERAKAAAPLFALGL
ncbi:MAG: hypothetical protein JW718_03150 [Desulfovibrionaceae bacterium]|nr:hypothetical protein [Desulfovibrionaceae bacterium]